MPAPRWSKRGDDRPSAQVRCWLSQWWKLTSVLEAILWLPELPSQLRYFSSPPVASIPAQLLELGTQPRVSASYPFCSPTGTKWKPEEDKSVCFHHRFTFTVISEGQVHRIPEQWRWGHIARHSDGEVAILGTAWGHWNIRADMSKAGHLLLLSQPAQSSDLGFNFLTSPPTSREAGVPS